ncbi:MAG: aliphatic sulfonate ABC transporter substrate-binding protein [Opitutus sp.]|nr:aliphatic sulfonate ABC transporter substrate-binding protein [Opitutus sp.]
MKLLARLLIFILAVCAGLTAAAKTVLRVGYFPNITHAQGVLGASGTREGKGWFEERLGPDVEVQWFSFNAGPSAMEAVFAGSIDLAYVGPNPALNAYIRSKGAEIRVLAGAAEGGAALVVRSEAGIAEDKDFRGKKLATPQLGNTQDVAARAYFKRRGFRLTPTGGEVLIVPTANPEQLTLFRTKQLDAAWTVEPWVSRLVLDGGGRIYVEQSDAVTTVLVARAKFLRERPELAEKFRTAHVALTDWINSHGAAAKEQVRLGLGAEMRREVPPPLMDAAWPRLKFTSELKKAQLSELVKDAQSVGYLRDAIPLDRLVSGKP